jgi:trk system potassium uptake protein TrkA
VRVAIAGAGAVGRSIALELVDNNHQVMLIERELSNIDPELVEAAEWVHADACELASLEEAGLETCDVVIAATGDDKVNLVVSLLAKTEFAVRRVVARVNDPTNEWLFGQNWGVDVAVSTPRLLAALVEEAVAVGDLVRLMTFRQGQAKSAEVAAFHAAAGQAIGGLKLPPDAGGGAVWEAADRAQADDAGARRRAVVRGNSSGRG